ncbi:MAG: AAA family ATPase [Anaerolineae bacterium]|nr:AAA family ATPase [Anaerolineae bacterium]
MPRLTISLLGSFEIELEGAPVAALSKVRALLAYLAVEADRRRPEAIAHRRESLAGLLWPDWPEQSARTNLRNALSKLRQAIGDRAPSPDRDTPHVGETREQPVLLITRETVQFNIESDCWLDVATFNRLVAGDRQGAGAARRLEEAVALYRGPFLEGFSVEDSSAFEDWALLIRERLEAQVLDALHWLTGEYERRGDRRRACDTARRRIALAPWQEQAHGDLMRLLALSGQRGAALAQYEACCRALKEELGVEPGQETQRLYQRIRNGDLAPPLQSAPEPESTPLVVDVGAIPISRETQAHSTPSDAQQIVFTPPPVSFPPQARPEPAEGGMQGGLEGERRVITALFSDVKGATALAGQIDTEDWVEIMSHALEILSAEIHRYGGEIDRYEGDGLVAFFGLSTAHEDDAERAVLAALAMREAIKRYAAELAESDGADTEYPIDLLLRVGLSTGEVIATHVGEAFQHGATTAMGRTIALASRLESAAEPGTVLVGEHTYRLVEQAFEWQSMGGIAVKGYGEPVAAYRPLKRRAMPGKRRGIEGLASPLVGRDKELDALEQAIARLRSGIGGIVTVVGEAGIGKSRLVAELRKQLARFDFQPSTLQWIEGRCLSYATGSAYHLWLDMLRDWLGLALDVPAVDVRQTLRERVRALCPDGSDEVYPYLGRMMGLALEEEAEAKLRGLDAESQRFLTFSAVETLLSCAAEKGQLVVVCEDLHWADATSLALLEQLLPLIDRAALLLICVFRPERAHGCWQIKERAARDHAHGHTDLALEPLSPSAGATLVGNLLHVEDLLPELRQRILDRAEGNPFFVEEILRSLIDEEVVVHDETSGHWRATREVGDIPIPGTLHGVLSARIDRLPGESKRVLQLASVIGRIFAYPILAAIISPLPSAGEGRRALDAQLVALERAQLIRTRARLPEREYAFKHVLTQEAAYANLLKRERRAAHRQVAEALEQLYPERIEEQLGLLAHHWEQAGERERAVAYLHRVGKRAAAQYANEEAIGYLSRALALAPVDDLQVRYLLTLARERVYNVQALREAQGRDLEALRQAAELLAREDDGQQGTRRLAEVALREANYSQRMRDNAAASAAAERAIHLARADQDLGIAAEAYLVWGRCSQDLETQEGRFEQALALARVAGHRPVEADGLRELGMIASKRFDQAAAKRCYEQALSIYRDLGDRRGEGRVLNTLGFLCAEQGDYAADIAYHEQGLRLCRETGARWEAAWAMLALGMGFLSQGDYAPAIGHMEGALGIWREIGDRWTEVLGLLGLGWIRHTLGDYPRARECYEQVYSAHSNRPGMLATVQSCQSLLYHHLGDGEAAHACAQQALDQAKHTEDLGQQASALLALGHALATLEDWTGAAAAYRQALALREQFGQHHLAPDPLAGLARVALAQGEPAEAMAHVEAILGYLEARPTLEGTWEPLHIYLTCYHVLCANGDPRAQGVLDAGYRLLQERAAKIDDEALRRSYLENVAANRELVAEWEALKH